MKIVKINKIRSRKRTHKWLRLLFLMVICLLLIEIGWLLVTNLSNKTVIANWASIEKGCWVDALFLRKEEVLRAEQNGRFYSRYQTGVMVPKSEIIGYVTANQENKYSEQELKRYKIINSLRNEQKRLEYNIQRVNDRLKEQQNSQNNVLKKQKTNSDYDLLKQEKEILQKSIEKIAEQLVQYNSDDLTDEHLELVLTKESGFFSLEYDGYESKMNPDNFLQLKINDFKPKYKLQQLTSGSKVKSGGIVGKIVDPFHQIVAVVINTRQIGVPKKGERWEIKIKNSWRKISIIDIIALSSDKMIIGFNAQEIGTDFSPMRYRRLFLVYKRVNGVSVPAQTIYQKKGQYFVKVAKGNSFFEREINLIESDGQKAIVEGINLGTAVKSR